MLKCPPARIARQLATAESIRFPTGGDGCQQIEKVKDMVAQEFILVQDNVKELSERMSTGLQQYFSEVLNSVVEDGKKALAEQEKVRKELVKEKKRKLARSKKAIRKQTDEVVKQVHVRVNAARDMALQRVDEVIGAVAKWQRDTNWPVRAGDWTPQRGPLAGLPWHA